MSKKIILASGSPRRRELLSMLGVEFDVMVDDTPEEASDCLPPQEVVCELAKFKGDNILSGISSDEDVIVISADTVVSVDNEILGKPKNADDAEKMLLKLSNRSHNVYTGVCITDKNSGKSEIFYEKTEVFFKKLDIIEIKDYINTGEPMDKAGAYGIQNIGALFVEKIYGDYFNVVGLPVCKLGEVLKNKFDFKLF